MRKFIALLLTAATLVSFAACSSETPAPDDDNTAAETTSAETYPEYAEPEKLSFTEEVYEGNISGKIRITPVFYPEYTTERDLTWYTLDPELATVDSNGVVICNEVGTARIAAVTSNGIIAVCKVATEDVIPTGMTLSEKKIELKTTESVNIGINFVPDNSTHRKITWATTDIKVATASSGKVTGVGVGDAVIYAITENGIIDSCNVHVELKQVPATSIWAEKSELTLEVGEQYRFYANLLPANTTETYLAYTSSDTSVVKVDNRDLTALKAGTSTLTLTTQSGIKKECKITVVPQTVTEKDTRKATAAPVITGKAVCYTGYWCVTGTCESGATITVTSHLTDKPLVVESQFNRFFFPFTIAKGATDELTITAQSEGKAVSTKVKLELKYVQGGCDVRVGEGSWLHYPATEGDFRGSNLLSDSELKNLKSAIKKRVTEIRKKSGVDTKFVIFIAPNNGTIYPEYGPVEWKNKKESENSRRQQVINMVKEWNTEDVICIDCKDYIMEHKNLGHLYYQTDTHWNTFGAYFGYYKLMEAIAVDFPAAAPYELDKFNYYKSERGGGDLVSFLGIGNGNGSETTMECSLKIKSRVSFVDYATDGVNDCITTKVDDPSLPVAVVQRDSFGGALHQFLIENFSTLLYTPFGADKSIGLTYCEKLQPDYYIRVMVERDLYGKIVN